MLPPPTSPHSPPCSLAMKSLPHLLLLLLLLLPQVKGFTAIKVKANRKEWLLSKNTLVAAKQSKTNPELKQILKQVLRRHLKHCFTKQSGKAGTETLCKEDFRRLLSKKDKKRKNTQLYMERMKRRM